MAAAFVAERAKNTGVAATSFSVPVSGITVRNHLILLIEIQAVSAGATVSSVTDNAAGGSNTYQIDAQGASAASAIGIAMVSAYIDPVKGAPTSLTITMSKSVAASWKVEEFSGLAAAAWFDKATQQAGAATTAQTSASVTPIAAGELALMGVVTANAEASFTAGLVGGSTATQAGTPRNSAPDVVLEYLLSCAAGAQTGAGTLASAPSSTSNVRTILGFYKAAVVTSRPISDTGLTVSDSLLSTWTENFESGTIASLFPAGSGGTVALDNTVAFTGAQSLHVNSDPAYVRKNFVVNNGIIVMRFYVRFGGIPSSGIEFMNFIGGGGRIGIDAVTKQIGFNFGTSQTYGALSGIVPNVGQWYRIDCRCDASNNPWVFDWQIDGVAQTQVTFASAANLTVDTYIGHSTGFSVTLNAYFDTIKVSQIAADYPIGPLATIYNRTASDTGLTVSESLARNVALGRALTDTGLAVTDSVPRAAVFARAVTDTGLTVTDSTAATKTSGAVYNRTATDTGLTVSDAIARTAVLPRVAGDTGLSLSESLTRTVTHPRLLSDTGATITDTLRPCQLGWPVSDVAVGGWTLTPLWQNVDERYVPDDGDYVQSSIFTNDLAEVALRPFSSPLPLSGGTKLRYRVRRSNPTTTLTVYLMQGTTVVASWVHASGSLPASFATVEQVLTDPQVASISDYANLRVRFVANT